jgi:benzoyl-CoA reductase/2-hydroxyglutaryl-CoA dehydratase subunit BcrC/BadD/HgdB
MDSEKTIKDYSKKLEKLGLELLKIQYDFKIKDNPSEKYWIKKIQEFKKYHEKVVDYFTQSYSWMSLVDEEQAGIFLLRISKLQQLGVKLLEDMDKVKQNPASMNLKDKQQSKWSKEIRERLLKSNNDCLNHEKRMNVFFKEVYKNYLKK